MGLVRKIIRGSALVLNTYMENTNAGLTLDDLVALRTIIDQACTRGAFKASEMQAVGAVYDRLSTFVDAIIAQAPQLTPDTPTGNPQGESHD